MSKILCFTGTREGMSLSQRIAIRGLMTASARMEMRRVSRILHGGCIGADAQFHEILRTMGLLDRVEVYPSDIEDARAPIYPGYLTMHPPLPPLERNKVMVSRAHSLLATPKEFKERPRGGTWMTVREARRKGIPVLIVYPDGSRHLEEGNL